MTKPWCDGDTFFLFYTQVDQWLSEHVVSLPLNGWPRWHLHLPCTAGNATSVQSDTQRRHETIQRGMSADTQTFRAVCAQGGWCFMFGTLPLAFFLSVGGQCFLYYSHRSVYGALFCASYRCHSLCC